LAGGFRKESLVAGKKALAALLVVLVPGSALVVAVSPGITTPPAPPEQ
jgi:hypothetical protein